MKKFIKLVLAGLCVGSTACSQKTFVDLEVDEFDAYIEQNKDNGVQVVDVRTAEEFAAGTFPNAILIDVKKDDFLEQADAKLDRERPVALYCRSGRRSEYAANLLTEAGFENVVNLKGGMKAWMKKHFSSSIPASQMDEAIDEFGMEKDQLTTMSGKSLSLHCIKHASVRIVYEGKNIYIDPVTRLGNWSADYSKMPKADYIFITHEHGDHYDKAAIDALSKAGTTIVLNKRCGEMLGKGTVMGNGDSKTLADDFSVEAVPAYNNTPGREKFHPKGRDNGYVLTVDGMRIYLAGDTEDIEEMAQLKDIDVAFLPCNQPYTMTPDQLVRAAKVIKPRILFPYHYGDTNVEQTVDMLKKDGINVRIRCYQ